MSDPDDMPTSPDLAVVTCPACRGEGKRLKRLEAPGFTHRAVWGVCECCHGEKTVSRERHAQWHAEGHADQ